MCVPSRISDATLRYASKYRSKERIPALSYLHWANLGTITRSSQPMVGLNNRSLQDEKLIEAVFTSHHFADPHSAAAHAASAASAQASGSGGAANVALIYGAQATNLIIDARPTTNAMANRAKGAGTENMEHYKGCKKAYLGVENIHVMRDSLNRLADVLRASEPPVTFGAGSAGELEVAGSAADPDGAGSSSDAAGPHSTAMAATLSSSSRTSQRSAIAPLDYAGLKRSGWLKHISALLEGTLIIARNVHINSSHVLIHCSDGWDRTSQLSALAQICLDPYYRTLDGLAVLVEKDWCSFGHRFWDRCGHASSQKYFATASGHGEESEDEDGSADGQDTERSGFEVQSQAAANAFWGFTKSIANNFQGSGHSGSGAAGAHLKETSPVFLQFLDCVWQLQRQFPGRFEYNATLLVELHTQLHECRFGTFLSNCEREARIATETAPAPANRTVSVWDALLAPEQRKRFIDPSFDASLDDPKRDGADMGVLLPVSRDVRYFAQIFGRQDEEMNAGIVAEIEERKRALQAAEDARAAAAAAALQAAGPSEASRSALGAVVEGGSGDPGRDLGAAAGAVGRVEAPLAYKPRAARPRPAQAAAAPAVPTLAPQRGASPVPPAGAAAPSAAEAAQRMKGLLVSGWGRLQAAYGEAAPSEDPAAHRAPADPLSQDDSAAAWADVAPRKSTRAEPSPGPLAAPLPPARTQPESRPPAANASESNPWAARPAAPALDPLAARTQPPAPTAAAPTARTQPDEAAAARSASYDPLGVGL
jgi:hypothetical protein